MDVVLAVICFTAALAGIWFATYFFSEATRFLGKDLAGVLGAVLLGYLTAIVSLALLVAGIMIAAGSL